MQSWGARTTSYTHTHTQEHTQKNGRKEGAESRQCNKQEREAEGTVTLNGHQGEGERGEKGMCGSPRKTPPSHPLSSTQPSE